MAIIAMPKRRYNEQRIMRISPGEEMQLSRSCLKCVKKEPLTVFALLVGDEVAKADCSERNKAEVTAVQ